MTVVWASLWLIITGADPSSLVLGLPAIGAATWVSLRFAANDPRPMTFWLGWFMRLPRFALFFLRESLLGGIDVAKRALNPTRLSPGFVVHQPQLQQGAARLFYVNCISLMPGTLSAQLSGREVAIHSLDLEMDNAGALRSLERQVARLFADPAGEQPHG